MSEKGNRIKTYKLALPSVAQWIECQLQTKRSLV